MLSRTETGVQRTLRRMRDESHTHGQTKKKGLCNPLAIFATRIRVSRDMCGAGPDG